MKKNYTIPVFVAFLLIVSSFIMARGIDECDTALKLTPEQKEKIQKICLDFQKEMLPFQTELKAKSLEMKELFLAKADLSKLNSKIDEMAKIKAEMMKKHLAHRNQIMELLSEDQKALFDSSGFGCGMSGGMMGSGMHGSKSCGMMGCGQHGGKHCGMMGCGMSAERSCDMKSDGMHKCSDEGGCQGKDMEHNCKK